MLKMTTNLLYTNNQYTSISIKIMITSSYIILQGLNKNKTIEKNSRRNYRRKTCRMLQHESYLPNCTKKTQTKQKIWTKPLLIESPKSKEIQTPD